MTSFIIVGENDETKSKTLTLCEEKESVHWILQLLPVIKTQSVSQSLKIQEKIFQTVTK